MVEVKVARLGVDASSSAFVVVLQELNGERTLPIWIGRPEAESIAAHLNNIERSRPMTHDLAQHIITGLGGLLRRVQVTHVHDGTFFAELHLTKAGHPVIIDSRPSDAIAIAIRLDAPIFVADILLEVGEDVDTTEGEPAPADDDTLSADELQRQLTQLRPEDFGRFSI